MDKYVLKNTGSQVVLKVYTNESNGGTVDVALSELAFNGVTPTTVGFSELFWTCRPNKTITVQRVETESDLEGGYFFANTGTWKFQDFEDKTYGGFPLRFTFDGPGTVIVRLSKV